MTTQPTTTAPAPRPAGPTHTEAPFSASFRVLYRGRETLVTLRGASGDEVLPRLDHALDWFSERNGDPLPAGDPNGAPAPAGPTPTTTTYHYPLKGKPGDPGDPGEHVQAITCPVCQGAILRRRANANGYWYSHALASGGYCNGTPRPAAS